MEDYCILYAENEFGFIEDIKTDASRSFKNIHEIINNPVGLILNSFIFYNFSIKSFIFLDKIESNERKIAK